MQSTKTVPAAAQRRLLLAVAGLVVIPLGLAARFLVGGWVADATGGILYAVLMYLLVAFIKPRWPIGAVAALAWGLCMAIELFQLTPIPRDLGAIFPPARLALGSTFVATDLVAYAAGVFLAWGADRLWRRRRSGI